MEKIKLSVSLILFLTVVLSSCAPAVTLPTTTNSPTEGTNTFVLPDYALSYDAQNVVFVPEDVIAFMNADLKITSRLPNMSVRDYADGSTEKNAPLPVILAWQDTGAAEYTVYLSRYKVFDGAQVFKSNKNEVAVTNLLVGTDYYWRVSDESGKIITPVYSFNTSAAQPRTICVDGVGNFRDLGGVVSSLGDGAVLKQGMIYRSANLDKITEAGVKTFAEELGIKTDLDLRRSTEDDNEAHSVPVLDNAGIKYFNAAVCNYEKIFNKKKFSEQIEKIRKAVSLFADPENYPVVFHCAIGTDRTGTIAFLIQGLLGVDAAEAQKHYYLSWFSAFGEDSDSRFNDFLIMYNRLSKYKSKDLSLAENIEAYLLDIGVTQAEIDSIRSIMIEYTKTNG